MNKVSAHGCAGRGRASVAVLHLEELLRDELAGSEPVGAWEHALQTIFLKVDPSALSRFKLGRLRKILPAAIENLDKWMIKAREIGALKRLDPNQELPKFQAGLIKLQQAFGNAGQTSGEARELYQSILEQLDEEVFQFLSRQDRFYRLVAAHLELLEPEVREKTKNAFRALENGFSELGMERSEQLRIARTEANFVAAMPFGEQCIVATLIGAVANWKITRCPDETRKMLRRAWPKAQKDHDAISGIVGRILGNLDWQDDDPDTAWHELVLAADCDGDEEALLEATRLALRLKKWDQARILVQRGMEQSSLFAIRMLACEELVEIVGDVLEAIVGKQRSLRQQIGLELTTWNADVNRIRQAAKQGDVMLPFLDSFDDARKSIAKQIATSDLIQATALIIRARNARHEMVRLATQTIHQNHAEVTGTLATVKVSVDHAWVEREAMIEAAVAKQKVDVHVAREALQHSLREADKNQSGCVVGFGSGCGAFLLYLMIAAFLTAQGIESGFGTIFGWFGLAASGIPITFTVMAQLAYGAQRATLDKALHDKIKLAQVAYESAAKQADNYYREQVLKLKQGLGDLEVRAVKLEKAIAVLNGV